MSIVRIHQQLFRNCFSVRCIQFSSIVFNISTKNKFCTNSTILENPLLNIDKLPAYSKITGESVESAVPLLLTEIERNFAEYEEALKESNKNYTWENVITHSELIFKKFDLAWRAVSHLYGVRNNAALRTAYEKVQPSVVSMGNKVSQSKAVFEGLKYLDLQNISGTQKRIIESSIKSMRNTGVHLEGNDKNHFNEISQKLAELSTKFTNNVLDSTKEFSYVIHDKKDTEGLPDTLLAFMASSANTSENKPDVSLGPWKLSLDMPCFQPFMMYSQNRDFRELAYLAYISRASSGETDNSDIIQSIRELRKQKSSLLGFENYSVLSLDGKMAKTPSAVWEMIFNLRNKLKHVAQNEMEDLEKFALHNGHEGELKHWDISFWSEKQKEHLFNLKEEELREYFPLERVLTGLFTLSTDLFGIKIEEVEKGTVETWHEDVRFFNIMDKNGSHIASFFLDLYARSHEKNGGAWHNSALDLNEAFQMKPVSYLVCNQRPPVGDVPSLMTINEVRTLFHEFGHGLQHMLTKVKFPAAAGINNIEWDAVELPSQFMENWLYDWNTLKKITSHYISGENLPFEVFEQLLKTKKYQAGMSNLRQLYFAALDMELHTSDDDWVSVMNRVSEEYTILKPHKQDKFPCGFLHIFAGGYAAGYYSYKWAEVLSADAFSAFEEVGLDNRDQITRLGKRFHETILSKGGSVHPEVNFIDFRGRKAHVDALLRSYGIS